MTDNVVDGAYAFSLLLTEQRELYHTNRLSLTKLRFPTYYLLGTEFYGYFDGGPNENIYVQFPGKKFNDARRSEVKENFSQKRIFLKRRNKFFDDVIYGDALNELGTLYWKNAADQRNLPREQKNSSDGAFIICGGSSRIVRQALEALLLSTSK